MKIKQLLTKTLLVAVGLLAGASNVWADVTETVVVNQNFDDGTTTLFANTSRITVSNDNNAKFLTASNSTNGYSLSTYNFSSAIGTDATAVKIEFAYWIPNSNASYYRYFTLGQSDLRTGFAQSTYSTAGAMFGMGLKRGKWNGAGNNVNYFSVNNGYTSQTGENVLGAWARAEVYIDFSTKKISYKITDVTNTTTYFEADDVDYMDSNASYCNQIDFFDCANSTTSYLDNLVITKYKDNSKVATKYTVKYQNAGGTDLKDAVEYDTYVGDTYTASSTDMATFYSDDTNTKYVYKSGNTSTAAVETASSNIITLVFDEYAKIDYTVKAQVSGADLTTLASGSAYSDGSTTAYWSKYLKVGDQWYEADEASYGAAITTAITNVAFTATDDIDYFFECESMTYSNTYNTYNGTEVSNGTAKTLGASDATVKTTTTIAAGVYTITLNGKKWDNKGDNYEVAYSTDDTNWVPVENISYESSEEGEKTLSGVIIPANSYIRLRTTGGTQTPRRYLDYLVLQKTEELPTSVSKSISNAGWATYCSPYVLDLSNATGLTDAYIVTGGENGVLTKNSVKGGTVPANTGLLLKGDAGTATIPVATSSNTNVTSNILVGVTEETKIAQNTGWVLMASPSLGFYQNANETEFTVGANTAYIPVSKLAAPTGGARASYLLFDDMTGISQVAGSEVKTSGAIYNLNGQRVSNPTKGIYIIDGVKVAME